MLDLGYNRMGDMGIELLALWLRTRPPLLGLNVAGNGIKDTGARFDFDSYNYRFYTENFIF